MYCLLPTNSSKKADPIMKYIDLRSRLLLSQCSFTIKLTKGLLPKMTKCKIDTFEK